MNTKIKTTKTESGKFSVSTPYNEVWAARARQMGGKWNAKSREWEISPTMERAMRGALLEIFGEDGKTKSEKVTLRVDLDSLKGSEYGDELKVGGIVYIKKWGRDGYPVLNEGAVVVEGAFKPEGGSVKNPCITWGKGTVVELTVPAPVALAQIEKNPSAWSLKSDQATETAEYDGSRTLTESELTPAEQIILKQLRSLSQESLERILDVLG